MPVMTLRTPRRRISPRTKYRYRVIRNFFRKALGTTSQTDVKIDSSTAINVTDLKHKIIGLEHQLSEVSKHCQELSSLENTSYRTIPLEHEIDLESVNSHTGRSSQNKLDENETTVLYKQPEVNLKKSADNCSIAKTNNIYRYQTITRNSEDANIYNTKIKNKKSKLTNCNQNLHKRKTVSACENLASAYSTSSFHTVVDSRMAHRVNGNGGWLNRPYTRSFTDQIIDEAAIKKNKIARDKTKTVPNNTKSKKTKNNFNQLDQDFIADIIRRQYKPIKMFGRRSSDISQFSAPVCRDQEYSVREEIQEDPDLCSCCHEEQPNNYKTRYDLNKMRSVCDARLYNTRKQSLPKHRRNHLDPYNDSQFYDLIPVKEKTSPKSQRKFVEDTMMTYNYYKEVPPSPRTLRPRLNLEAQYYTEFEDFMARKHLNKKCSAHNLRKMQDCGEYFKRDGSFEEYEGGNEVKRKRIHLNKIPVQKLEQPQQNNSTMSSLQEANLVNIQNVTVDTPLNKTQETNLSTDKTDKALCEIKDILQNFLREIKKEGNTSQCEKSDVTSKIAETSTINHQQNVTASIIPNSGQNFNNYSIAHCGMTSFMPNLTNPCCYPILPVCPMNCMQSGYIAPNSSVTCAKCASSKDNNNKEKNNMLEICTPETEELIKKIYKCVTQSPRDKKEEFNHAYKRKEAKLTSRSVGGSNKVFKHDAKVGTTAMKCYSNSCEAIGSRMISDSYYSTTNPTYSDTVLEKLSLEVTPTDSNSETDVTAGSMSGKKSEKNRFIKVLRSFGIKNKKKDVIEEMSESESTLEVNVKTKPPPFRQELKNYMVHDSEYYHPPPVPPNKTCQEHPNEYQEYRAPHYHGAYHPPVQEMYNPHLVHQQTTHEHKAPHYHPMPIPTAPPYSQSFDRYSPQPQNVPLCLKEIEVKSIGTQSERKMSFFNKMKTKIQVPIQSARSEEYPQKNCSTQTSQNKPGLFNWRNLENKPNKNTNPIAFSYLKQKQLAEGDITMRNAMLKKLFYKKNPFSPRNLLVRTLMGKDKSSFGEPPMMYRPKMFL